MAAIRYTSMRKTPEEKFDSFKPLSDAQPEGPSLCLTEHELDKLGLPHDCEVGNLLHLKAMGEVVNVTHGDGPMGKHCTVSLVLTHMTAEDEGAESPPEPEPEEDE